MQRIVLLFSLFIFSVSTFGQEARFEEAVKEALASYRNSRTLADRQAATAKLERLAAAEPNRWETHYYVAYTKILTAGTVNGGKAIDAMLDDAQKSIDKAVKLNGDKSEMYVLQGMLYAGRIKVKAMRGMTLGPKSGEVVEKAIKENPENPRAYFLKAQNTLIMPKTFGGGYDKALPFYRTAKLKFDKEKRAGVKGLMPSWGADENEMMLKRGK